MSVNGTAQQTACCVLHSFSHHHRRRRHHWQVVRSLYRRRCVGCIWSSSSIFSPSAAISCSSHQSASQLIAPLAHVTDAETGLTIRNLGQSWSWGRPAPDSDWKKSELIRRATASINSNYGTVLFSNMRRSMRSRKIHQNALFFISRSFKDISVVTPDGPRKLSSAVLVM